MCGLFGGFSYTGLNKSERAFIKGLFYVNSFRGIDSTGVFDFLKHPEKVREKLKHAKAKNAVCEMNYWKRACSPVVFAETKYNELCLNRWEHEDPVFIAGHNRLATIGAVNQNNAHPFYFPEDPQKKLDGIIGMHNGTIYGEFSHRKAFQTDSEALYYNIYRYGLEETLDRIKNFHPAYALVWYNTTQKTLNFFRNKERSLYYMGHLVKYWSSEDEALLFVQRYTKHNMHPLSFKEGVLYTFDPTGFKNELVEKDIKVPRPAWFAPRGQSVLYPTRPPTEGGMKTSGESTVINTVDGIKSDLSVHMRVPPAKRDLPKGVNYDGCESDKIPFKNGFFDTIIRTEEEITSTGRLTETGYAYFFDEKSKKYFTPYWAGCLARVRWENEKAEELKKKAKEEAKLAAATFRKLEGPNEVFRSFGFNNKKRCTEYLYKQKVEKGCCYCGDPVAISDKLHWVDDDDFLCISCQEKAQNPHDPIHELFKFYQVIDLIDPAYLDEKGQVIPPQVILH